MMEQQRQRVERAISTMIHDMYKTHLRKMQHEMHLCAARCCDDKHGTLDSVQNCIENCATPLIKAQDYVQNQLGEFQGRLQSCVMQCSDDMRTQMPPKPKNNDVARYQYQFEQCTMTCVDKHLNLIPGMMNSIKATLEKKM